MSEEENPFKSLSGGLMTALGAIVVALFVGFSHSFAASAVFLAFVALFWVLS